MSIFEVIILGIVQGLTEFIPVSSSGHLVLFHEVMNAQEAGLMFDVALHIGTLLALVIYFWPDIRNIVRGFFAGKEQERRMVWLLMIATVPAVIAGLLLESAAETTFRSAGLVMITLGLFGVVMLLSEKYAQKLSQNSVEKITLRQATIIGLSQAIAVVPGVSRSGVTISAGLFAGLDRTAAARFSFLLAIPVIFGAAVKVMLFDGGLSSIGDNPLSFGLGFLAAFISGLLAIRFLLRYVAKHSIAVFAYYRFAVAAIILLVLVLR